MSFSLYLMCMRDGQPAAFKTSLFDEVLGRKAINPQYPLYAVEYADGGCDEIRNDFEGEEEIEMVSFSHFEGDTFFEALWELADKAGAFFTWPAEGRSIAVPNRGVVANLPADMTAAMGPPYIVTNGRELYDAICGIEPGAPPT